MGLKEMLQADLGGAPPTAPEVPGSLRGRLQRDVGITPRRTGSNRLIDRLKQDIQTQRQSEEEEAGQGAKPQAMGTFPGLSPAIQAAPLPARAFTSQEQAGLEINQREAGQAEEAENARVQARFKAGLERATENALKPRYLKEIERMVPYGLQSPVPGVSATDYYSQRPLSELREKFHIPALRQMEDVLVHQPEFKQSVIDNMGAEDFTESEKKKASQLATQFFMTVPMLALPGMALARGGTTIAGALGGTALGLGGYEAYQRTLGEKARGLKTTEELGKRGVNPYLAAIPQALAIEAGPLVAGGLVEHGTLKSLEAKRTRGRLRSEEGYQGAVQPPDLAPEPPIVMTEPPSQKLLPPPREGMTTEELEASRERLAKEQAEAAESAAARGRAALRGPIQAPAPISPLGAKTDAHRVLGGGAETAALVARMTRSEAEFVATRGFRGTPPRAELLDSGLRGYMEQAKVPTEAAKVEIPPPEAPAKLVRKPRMARKPAQAPPEAHPAPIAPPRVSEAIQPISAPSGAIPEVPVPTIPPRAGVTRPGGVVSIAQQQAEANALRQDPAWHSRIQSVDPTQGISLTTSDRLAARDHFEIEKARLTTQIGDIRKMNPADQARAVEQWNKDMTRAVHYDRIAKSGLSEAGRTIGAEAHLPSGTVISRFSQSGMDALNRLKGLGKRQATTFDITGAAKLSVEAARDAAIVGKEFIRIYGSDFGAWSKAMIEQIGPHIERHLKAIWANLSGHAIEREGDYYKTELSTDRFLIQHGESALPGGKLTWPGAEEKIAEYASRKTPFPPIDVIWDKETGWFVEDGSHRLEAARMRGDKTIPVRVLATDKPSVAKLRKEVVARKSWDKYAAEVDTFHRKLKDADTVFHNAILGEDPIASLTAASKAKKLLTQDLADAAKADLQERLNPRRIRDISQAIGDGVAVTKDLGVLALHQIERGIRNFPMFLRFLEREGLRVPIDQARKAWDFAQAQFKASAKEQRVKEMVFEGIRKEFETNPGDTAALLQKYSDMSDAEVTATLMAHQKANLFDKFLEVWILAPLARVGNTFVRNPGNNAAMNVLVGARVGAQTRAGMLWHATLGGEAPRFAPGAARVYFERGFEATDIRGKFNALMQGAVHPITAAKKAAQATMEAIDEFSRTPSKQTKGAATSRTPSFPITGQENVLVRGLKRGLYAFPTALELSDHFQTNWNYHSIASADMYSMLRKDGMSHLDAMRNLDEAILNAPEELKARWDRTSQKMAFRNDPGTVWNKMAGVTAEVPLVRAFMRYLRTPVNIAKLKAQTSVTTRLTYEALAPIYKLMRSPEEKAAFWKRYQGQNGHAIAVDLAATSALGTTAAWLFLNGQIGGRLHRVGTDEWTMEDAQGKPNYWYRVPGTNRYASYNWMDIPGGGLGSLSDMLQDVADGKSKGDELWPHLYRGYVRSVVTATDNPYTRLIQTIEKATDWNNPQLIQELENEVKSGIVPGIFQEAANAIDTIIRESKGIGPQAQSAIPGASLGLPPRLTPMGNVMQRSPLAGLGIPVPGIGVGGLEQTLANQGLAFPPIAPRKDMPPEIKNAILLERKHLVEPVIIARMGSPWWKTASTKDKQAWLDAVGEAYRDRSPTYRQLERQRAQMQRGQR